VESAISRLLDSDDPSLRLGALVRVLGRDPSSPDVQLLQTDVRNAPRVQRLLSERQADGTIPRHPYAKWDGAHWVLSALAELGYPPGDDGLIPMREQVLGWLLSPGLMSKSRLVAGRARLCASQEGNAIYSLLTLGIADERVDLLVDRLLKTQWPDGGWNCDRKPEAHVSSFHETWLPLRALALYARSTRNRTAREAADRAAEVFLSRSLFKRRSDGTVMNPKFLQLAYPPYWRYDLLAGLKVMAEAGCIPDARCRDALDLLLTKQLPDGSFPAEAKYYRVSEKKVAGRSLVDWGPTGATQGNPFVTLDALAVLCHW
jgi:hypothetical protein